MDAQGIIFGLVIISLVALIILLRTPILGLYISYFILWTIPIGNLRMNLPIFFRTPLNVVCLITAISALARAIKLHRGLMPSRLYTPIIICVTILGMYTFLGHGTDTGNYLELMIKGMWPFFMILLLVDTPKKVRVLLTTAGTAVFIQVFLILPSQIAQVNALRMGHNVYLRMAGMAVEKGGVLPSVFGGVASQTSYTYALVAPIFLSLYLMIPKKQKWIRRFSILGFVAMSISIMLAGYLRGVLGLCLGAIVVLRMIPHLTNRKSMKWVLNSLIIVMLLTLFFKYTPGGEQATTRITNYGKDSSIVARLWMYGKAWSAFLESPLFGWGFNSNGYVTPGGHLLFGDAGIIFICGSFGILFFLPLCLFLWRVWNLLATLAHFQLATLERALLIGFMGTYIVYVAENIIEGWSFGTLPYDFVMWTIIGLITIWNNKLKTGPDNQSLI